MLNFKTKLLVGLFAIIAFSLIQCEEEAAMPISPNFQFIVISDTHIRLPGNPDDNDYNNAGNIQNLERAVERINTDFPETDFVLVSGDMVGCLFSDNPDDYLVGQDNPAETFKTIMDDLQMPYYTALGNHDYQKGYNPALHEGIMSDNPKNIEALWQKVLGRESYYSFWHKGFRFIILNSNKGIKRDEPCIGCTAESHCTGGFDDAQMNWFEKQLQKMGPVVLIFHHPVETDIVNKVWSYALDSFQVHEEDRFYQIANRYKNKIKGIFVGHGHVYAHDTLNGVIPVYETGAVGDGMSNYMNMHLVTASSENQSLNVMPGNPNATYNDLNAKSMTPQRLISFE